jgi:hypothetical protein
MEATVGSVHGLANDHRIGDITLNDLDIRRAVGSSSG